jgi:ATP-dependent DNA ligase
VRNGNDCEPQALVCKWPNTPAARADGSPARRRAPAGEGWQYEPKWDGFRALAERDGDEVKLTSRSGKPLGRYFPEVLDMLRSHEGAALPARWRADHSARRRLSFEALQLRLHPAESRIRKLRTRPGPS